MLWLEQQVLLHVRLVILHKYRQTVVALSPMRRSRKRLESKRSGLLISARAATPARRRARLRDHERQIKRLETDASAIVGVVDELPKLKQEVAARTTQVETKMSMELGEMRETLTTRLQAAEKELDASSCCSSASADDLGISPAVVSFWCSS